MERKRLKSLSQGDMTGCDPFYWKVAVVNDSMISTKSNICSSSLLFSVCVVWLMFGLFIRVQILFELKFEWKRSEVGHSFNFSSGKPSTNQESQI